jgi:hypothetical protein
MKPSPLPAMPTSYAYETTPNKPIIAGEEHGTDSAAQPSLESLGTPPSAPATLGMLATGARGLSVWRREELSHSSSGND